MPEGLTWRARRSPSPSRSPPRSACARGIQGRVAGVVGGAAIDARAAGRGEVFFRWFSRTGRRAGLRRRLPPFVGGSERRQRAWARGVCHPAVAGDGGRGDLTSGLAIIGARRRSVPAEGVGNQVGVIYDGIGEFLHELWVTPALVSDRYFGGDSLPPGVRSAGTSTDSGFPDAEGAEHRRAAPPVCGRFASGRLPFSGPSRQ